MTRDGSQVALDNQKARTIVPNVSKRDRHLFCAMSAEAGLCSDRPSRQPLRHRCDLHQIPTMVAPSWKSAGHCACPSRVSLCPRPSSVAAVVAATPSNAKAAFHIRYRCIDSSRPVGPILSRPLPCSTGSYAGCDRGPRPSIPDTQTRAACTLPLTPGLPLTSCVRATQRPSVRSDVTQFEPPGGCQIS
jgi:hypothetical protein